MVTKDFAIDEIGSAIHAHLILSTAPPPTPSSASASSGAAGAVASAAASTKQTSQPKANIKEKSGTPEINPATATTTAGSINSPYDRWTLQDESTLNYGYLSKTGGQGMDESANSDSTPNKGGGYYLTTAINYTNGPPHMGHAYEATTADVIARFQRLKGDQPAYFVTGTDEHGQKIANTAADAGKEPMDICNQV